MSWEAWGDPEDPPELPDGWLCEEEAEDLQRNVVDLAMLVARLARALRKAAPEHDLPARAMDYLQREGLCGSPLREAPNAAIAKATGRVVADDAAPECTCAAKDMTFGRCCKLTPNKCKWCGHDIHAHDKQYGCAEDGCDCETPNSVIRAMPLGEVFISPPCSLS